MPGTHVADTTRGALEFRRGTAWRKVRGALLERAPESCLLRSACRFSMGKRSSQRLPLRGKEMRIMILAPLRKFGGGVPSSHPSRLGARYSPDATHRLAAAAVVAAAAAWCRARSPWVSRRQPGRTASFRAQCSLKGPRSAVGSLRSHGWSPQAPVGPGTALPGRSGSAH